METEDKKNAAEFSDQIADKERRKLKALETKSNAWLGLGMFGLVGWSIVVPTLLGAMLGVWLDKRYHQTFSWTLSLLVLGLLVGCVIAWNWVNKEDKGMHQKEE